MGVCWNVCCVAAVVKDSGSLFMYRGCHQITLYLDFCMFPCSYLCIFNNLIVYNLLIIDYLYFTLLLDVLINI